MQTNRLDTIQKEILANFDFDSVHAVMTAMGWKWAVTDGYRVPTIDELRVHALSIVRDAYNDFVVTKKTAGVSGGGLSVVIYENGHVTLDFVIETCNVPGENG